MSKYPASSVVKAQESSVAAFLKNLFGPLGSFLGAFFLVADPILSVGTLVGAVVLWRSLDYMFTRKDGTFKVIGVVLAALGALFALLTYF